MDILILDSWAVLCLLRREPAYQKVEQLWLQAADKKIRLLISVVNLAEVYYRLIRASGKIEARLTVSSLPKVPIEVVSATDEMVFQAAEIKAEYPIALGDCFAAALAIDQKAPVLTGDPEFKKLAKLVKIRWL